MKKTFYLFITPCAMLFALQSDAFANFPICHKICAKSDYATHCQKITDNAHLREKCLHAVEKSNCLEQCKEVCNMTTSEEGKRYCVAG